MATEGDQDATKEHAPTQRRLDEARRRGEVPRSADLTAAATMGGFMLAILLPGVSLTLQAGTTMAWFLGRPEQVAVAGSGSLIIGIVLGRIVVPLSVFVLFPAVAALAASLIQGGLTFSPEKLRMNWARLSLLANARQKFGIDALFSFGKSLIKLVAVGAILVVFLISRLPEILATAQLSPAGSLAVLMGMITDILLVIFALTIAIGAADYLWQWLRHHGRLRMSREEMKEEMRDSEGDPHVKAQRRQRGHDIATNRMLLDVPKADVVIVNPSHYAIALKWERGQGSAPVCVAKGVDEIAARIREAAATAGVPLHRDPPTARALHASVEIGQQIRPEHYRAVAAAIRFAEAMRRRRERARR